MISDNRYFYHPSSQNVSLLGFFDPDDANIKISVEKYGSLQIKKIR